MAVSAVIFDVGKVLYDWEPRFLYERLIDDDRALDAFLRDVVTPQWHFQHDAGRDFAETSAELIAHFPRHEALINAWSTHFGETIRGPIPGMEDIVAELDSSGVPLFAITNFSHEFWPPFRAQEKALFDRFRDIVVSGDEKLAKPDLEIFSRALSRFGLTGPEALFIDDRADNIDSARRVGLHTHLFESADRLRAELQGYGLLAG